MYSVSVFSSVLPFLLNICVKDKAELFSKPGLTKNKINLNVEKKVFIYLWISNIPGKLK